MVNVRSIDESIDKLTKLLPFLNDQAVAHAVLLMMPSMLGGEKNLTDR